jgi:hypothetical protein
MYLFDGKSLKLGRHQTYASYIAVDDTCMIFVLILVVRVSTNGHGRSSLGARPGHGPPSFFVNNKSTSTHLRPSSIHEHRKRMHRCTLPSGMANNKLTSMHLCILVSSRRNSATASSQLQGARTTSHRYNTPADGRRFNNQKPTGDTCLLLSNFFIHVHSLFSQFFECQFDSIGWLKDC